MQKKLWHFVRISVMISVYKAYVLLRNNKSNCRHIHRILCITLRYKAISFINGSAFHEFIYYIDDRQANGTSNGKSGSAVISGDNNIVNRVFQRSALSLLAFRCNGPDADVNGVEYYHRRDRDGKREIARERGRRDGRVFAIVSLTKTSIFGQDSDKETYLLARLYYMHNR